MKCPNCAFKNRAINKFCEKCGAALGSVCARCGTSLPLEAEFCGNCGAPAPHASAPTVEKAATSGLTALRPSVPPVRQAILRPADQQINGERKPVTILFTDIVGSTALAERLDPEEWSEIVSGVHTRVSEAVYRYEGTVAQLLGDGVLAFFGAPLTHEDDPVRAVRAALDIRDAISAYSRTLAARVGKLEMRIGIHTGLVVVGTVGSDLHMEYLAIGDAVNLAARLQSACVPGAVLLSGATARLIRAAFDLISLGKIAVKGKTDLVEAFQVAGAKANVTGRRGTEQLLAPLVGRETQMATLRSALDRLVEQGGQIVSIIGEAGIGKTRLIEELRSSIQPDVRWLEGRSLSYGQAFSFWTVAQILKADLGISEDDPEPRLRLGLEQRVNELFADRANEILPYLGWLLGVKLEGEAAEQIAMLTAESLKQHTLAVLGRYFARLAEVQPIVVVFEDLHWADPSTINTLDALLPVTEHVPLMLIGLFRPERDHPCWKIKVKAETDYPHRYSEITLQPLSTEDTERLLGALLNSAEVPARFRRMIMERAEGNPFYLEELLRSLIEQGALEREGMSWRMTADLENVTLPDTLQGVLLARIGRLEEDVRHTLQLAAVIGRSFLLRLLEMIANAESELDGHLTELQRLDLIRQKARRPDIEYIFKHALTQEAAYNSLLLKRRREFHRQVAEALERLYPDRVEELAAMIGHHFERAHVSDKAIHYLTIAADRARDRYSNAEAISLYQTALAEMNRALGGTEATGALREQAAGLRGRLGDVLTLIGQPEEARTAYEEALASADAPLLKASLHRRAGMAWMAQRQPNNALLEYDEATKALGEPQAAVAWQREWLELQNERTWAYYWLGHVPGMQEIATTTQPVLLVYGTPGQRARFFRNQVILAFRRDRYVVSDETLAHARQAVEASVEAGVQSDVAFSTFVLGFSHMWRGEWDDAGKHLEASLALAERIEDMERQVLSLTYLTVVYRAKRDMERFRRCLARARQAAADAGTGLYVVLAEMQAAWQAWQEGDFDQAEAIGHAAIERVPTLVPFPGEWFVRLPLLAIHLRRGPMARAAENARLMLVAPQHRLPLPLEQALLEGLRCWEASDEDASRAHLSRAVELAEQGGYL